MRQSDAVDECANRSGKGDSDSLLMRAGHPLSLSTRATVTATLLVVWSSAIALAGVLALFCTGASAVALRTAAVGTVGAGALIGGRSLLGKGGGGAER